MRSEFELELQREEKESVNKGILVSIALHALIVSVLTLRAVFFTEEPIDFSAAVRVDIVGLPDKIDPSTVLPPKTEEPAPPSTAKDELPPKEVAETKPAEPVKPATKEPMPVPPKSPEKDTVNLEKTKSKQDAAMNRLKAMAALEKIKSQLNENTNKSSSPANTGASPNVQIKGNVISPGTALTGLAKLQHDSYLSDLDRHIRQNWALPEWLAKQDFKAQVRVQIDQNGQLVAKKIVRSSGNSTYDEYAMETIDRSVPFPRPPEKFQAIMEVNGFVVGFPE